MTHFSTEAYKAKVEGGTLLVWERSGGYWNGSWPGECPAGNSQDWFRTLAEAKRVSAETYRWIRKNSGRPYTKRVTWKKVGSETENKA